MSSPSKKQKTEQSTTMASAPEQFEGFMINSSEKWSDFTKEKVWSLPCLVIFFPLHHVEETIQAPFAFAIAR
jgi:hypothetical protein